MQLLIISNVLIHTTKKYTRKLADELADGNE